MTSDNNIIDDKKRDSEDEALAAELALGVLTGSSHSAAETRALNDPEFFRLVTAWQARLGGLIQATPAVSPRDQVWRQIETRLFQTDKSTPALSLPTRGGVWHSLFFWRAMTFAIASLSIGLGIFITINPVVNPSSVTPLIATLQAENAGPVFLAQLNPGTNNLTIRPVFNKDDAAHDLELWLIPNDKVARSLGILSKSGATQIAISDALQRLAGPEAVLAITVEPPGGSPTGKATGPIIALGPLTKL